MFALRVMAQCGLAFDSEERYRAVLKVIEGEGGEKAALKKAESGIKGVRSPQVEEL
jgi:hypothetical protein